MEKEKEGNKWRKVFFCFGSRRKTEMEKDKIFGDRKYFFLEEKKNGEGKGGKYLENENIFLFAPFLDMFIFLTF